MLQKIVENMQALLRKTLDFIRTVRASLQRHRDSSVTARLNEIYSKESSAPDLAIEWAQLQSLEREEW